MSAAIVYLGLGTNLGDREGHPQAGLAALRRRGLRFTAVRPVYDILFHADLVRRTPGLTLPHPRLHERRFVLVPLVEISPDLRHPVLGRTARELLADCPDRSRVEARHGQVASP